MFNGPTNSVRNKSCKPKSFATNQRSHDDLYRNAPVRADSFNQTNTPIIISKKKTG